MFARAKAPSVETSHCSVSDNTIQHNNQPTPTDARAVHYCPRKNLTIQIPIKKGVLSYQIVKIKRCGFLVNSARRIGAFAPFDQIREVCPIGQRDTH